jgi:hypothetical protein
VLVLFLLRLVKFASWATELGVLLVESFL